jgi:hypothetical protein
MKETEMFTQRLQADIALIEAKLIRFKVRGMGFTTVAKDRHEAQIEQLEEKIDAINESLGDVEKVDEHLQGDFKATIEKNLGELQALLEETTQSFTTEPGVEGLHGNDEGSFPYGKGLSGRSADKK